MIKRMLFVVCCAWVVSISAEIKPGPLFTDNMVLQRDKPVVVWGTAGPGEKVTVEFGGQKKTAVTDASNHWKVTLDPMPASSKPRKMTNSSNFNTPTLQYSNLLVGEVWFAGGQSNMRWALWNTDGAAELFESGGAELSGLRLFAMPEIMNELDADLPVKGWQKCTKENATNFSAVTWYFGRALKEKFKGMRLEYNEEADKKPWEDMTKFLQTIFYKF